MRYKFRCVVSRESAYTLEVGPGATSAASIIWTPGSFAISASVWKPLSSRSTCRLGTRGARCERDARLRHGCWERITQPFRRFLLAASQIFSIQQFTASSSHRHQNRHSYLIVSQSFHIWFHDARIYDELPQYLAIITVIESFHHERCIGRAGQGRPPRRRPSGEARRFASDSDARGPGNGTRRYPNRSRSRHTIWVAPVMAQP